MPTPPAAHQNAPATRMAAVFFFLSVFCSGFHVGGRYVYSKNVPGGHGMGWGWAGVGAMYIW